MLLMYKFHTGHLPSMFKNIFRKKTQLGVITRQSDHLYIKTCKTQVAFNSIRSKGANFMEFIVQPVRFPLLTAFVQKNLEKFAHYLNIYALLYCTVFALVFVTHSLVKKVIPWVALWILSKIIE